MKTMGKKRDINKGLRALLSTIEETNNPEQKTELVKELSSNIATVPVESIEANPFQPRLEFDPEELDNLVQSIQTYGLIQPITVRSLGGDKYQLISGERRWRASQEAGLTDIPAYIRVADDQGMLEMALVENIQRADLNAMEIAISYQRLMDECALTHEALSDRVGKNRSTITNYVRLLKLPPEIQRSVKNDGISMGHARALAGISDVGLQLDIFKAVTQQRLSVRATEDLIRSYDKSTSEAKAPSPAASGLTPEVLKIKDSLSARYGTKVDIKRSAAGKGQFTFRFGSDKEFNAILDLLAG